MKYQTPKLQKTAIASGRHMITLPSSSEKAVSTPSYFDRQTKIYKIDVRLDFVIGIVDQKGK